MATIKKTSKPKPERRAKKAADPDVDYAPQLVDHMAQGNEPVPHEAETETEQAEDA